MDIKHLIERGDATRKAKDFYSAATAYAQALALDPANSRALHGLADAYRGAGAFAKGVEVLERYLALKPGDAAAQARLGDAYRKTGQLDQAADAYRRALALNTNNRFALMGLGDLHFKANRFSEALVCWEPLLLLDPSLVQIRTMVGNIHRKALAFDKAIIHFRAILDSAPHNPYAVFGMADSLRGLGRFQESAPFWDEMLQLDPGNKQVLTRAGDCFFRLGQLAKAENLFARTLERGYEKAVHLGLARIDRSRGCFQQAILHYRAILDRQPQDIRTLLLVAETHREWKGPEAARDYLQGKLRQFPDAKELGRALERLS
jgi:tetratricopeptide (TPR) repeat protein